MLDEYKYISTLLSRLTDKLPKLLKQGNITVNLTTYDDDAIGSIKLPQDLDLDLSKLINFDYLANELSQLKSKKYNELKQYLDSL